MSITATAPPSVTRTGMLVNHATPVLGKDRAEWLRGGGYLQGVGTVERGLGAETQLRVKGNGALRKPRKTVY